MATVVVCATCGKSRYRSLVAHTWKDSKRGEWKFRFFHMQVRQQTEKTTARANNKHRIEPQSCGGAKETEWSVEIDRLYRGCYAALQSLIDTQTMQTRLLLRPVHIGFI